MKKAPQPPETERIFQEILTGAFKGSGTWPEPLLARPGAWAGLWRRLGVKAALAAQMV